MNIRYSIFFVACLCLNSCTNKGGKDRSREGQVEKVVINLSEATNHNLSDFVNTVKYIQLKTPSTETLGKGVLKIMEKYIYFHDYQQQCIFVFDREGDFVAKLDKLGNGPDEYLKLNVFFVNNNEREVEVWDTSRDRILTYQNVTFNLLKETKLKDNITFNSALRIDNNQYLLSTNGNRNYYLKKSTNADFFLFKEGKVERMFFDRKVKGQNHHQFSLFIKNIIVNDQQETFASVDYNNTIYKFNNSDFTPYLKVEYANGKSMDYELIADMTSKQRVEYFFDGDFLETASYPNMSVNNSNILVINYMFREKKGDLLTDSYRHYIWLKKEQKVIHAKSILNDITDFPTEVYVSSDSKGMISHEAWHKNHLIDVVSPYTELSENETAVIDGVGEIDRFDNPIILMMELKKL